MILLHRILKCLNFSTEKPRLLKDVDASIFSFLEPHVLYLFAFMLCLMPSPIILIGYF